MLILKHPVSQHVSSGVDSYHFRNKKKNCSRTLYPHLPKMWTIAIANFVTNVWLFLLQLREYYRVRKNNPELFANLSPSKYSDALDAGVQAVLHQRDEKGSKIYVFRLG